KLSRVLKDNLPHVPSGGALITMKSHLLIAAAIVAAAACKPAKPTTAPTPAAAKDSAAPTGPGGVSVPNADPFASTYVRIPSSPLVIRNVNVMTAAGPTIRNGMIAIADGKIVAVGPSV